MTYAFPIWIPIATWFVAGVSLLLSLALRKHRSFAMFLYVAVFVGGLLAPALTFDRVVINDQKLEQTTGFWWSPTVKGFQFSDVSSVYITSAKDWRYRQYEVWVVFLRNGETRQIDPGYLWEVNGSDIVRRLQGYGIEVRHDPK